MKIKKYLKEAEYNDPKSTFAYSKFKFNKNTKLALDNDIKITIDQLQSIRNFLREDGREKPDKNVHKFLGDVLKHFSHALPLIENFPDLRMNNEFEKDDTNDK
jgi:hypothetical protein